LDGIDLSIALLLAYFALRGWKRGLLPTLASLVAPVAGFLAAGRYGAEVGVALGDYVTAPETFLGFLAYPLTFLVVGAGVRLAAGALGMALGLGDSPLSKVGGALAGGGSAAFLVGAGVLLLGSFAPNRGATTDDGGLLTEKAHGTIERAVARLDRTWLAPRLKSLTATAIAQVFEEGALPEGLAPIGDQGTAAATASATAAGAAAAPADGAPRRPLGAARLLGDSADREDPASR
jgi:hypothetical protein